MPAMTAAGGSSGGFDSAADSKQICIFCQRTGEETAFNSEHVIPQNIGGALRLDNHVCKCCNSWLGSNVDDEVLRLPDTLRLMEALNLPHDRDGILRNYFDVIGEFDGGVLRGILKEGSAEFPTQKLADGSLLVHEAQVEEQLMTIARRKGLPDDDASSEIQRLLDAAPEGPAVTSDLLGITLARRARNLSVSVRPRREAFPARLIGKIAYEFLFLVLGRQLFHRETADTCERLTRTILGQPNPGAAVLRLKPPPHDPGPFHTIEFRNGDTMLTMRLLLFDQIEFLLALHPLPPISLSDLRQQFGSDVVGVQFRQRLDRHAMMFWAVQADGSGLRLA